MYIFIPLITFHFIQELLEGLNDADAAIEESFDSTIKICVGEIFVHSDENQAKQYVEKLRRKYKAENEANNIKLRENQKRLDDLKIILYAKFGERLRLEEE